MCVGCRLSTVILTLYKDVPWKGCVEYGFVFLKAKVGGRTVRMQFSLRKGLHILPHGVYGFPWQSLTKEGGSFDRPLSLELCLSIRTLLHKSGISTSSRTTG